MDRAGEGTPPATKSGRKVKRPTHFDDSPDSKEVASPAKRKDAAPASAKKSARKTLLLSAGETPPPAVKNGSDGDALKKSARKGKNGSGREESPEPEAVKKAAPASARKTLLKSAVKNSSADGAGTPKKTLDKEEPDAGLSRTGRKIKIPAHLKEFEDVVVPAATSRKSVAPVKQEPLEVEEKPVAKAVKRFIKQQATDHETEDEEMVGAKTPRRGKSLARKPVEEEEEVEKSASTKTPGRAKKLVKDDEEGKTPTKTPGRGRSVARKASVDEETTFEEKPAPKTYGRARSVARQTEEEEKPATKTPGKFVRKPDEQEEEAKPAPKTPGRTKSVPRRFADEEDEAKPAPKTPGRAKSMAARRPSVDDHVPVAPKTPSRRAKSIAPQLNNKQDAEDPLALPEESLKRESPVKKLDKPPAKTPSKRAKSPEPVEPAATSRSGRKIKPKKYFGEFEQDETVVPTVVAAAPTKPASPVKSPKITVASPIRPPQQQIVKKGSPYAPKKDQVSPVKRLSVPAQPPTAPVPAKKAKQDDKDAEDKSEGSPFKISPATEERQITKRNVNDHHHYGKAKPEEEELELPSPQDDTGDTPALLASTSEPEIVPEQDPLAASSSEAVEADKPKRGRKTLAAAQEVAKPTPKTPARRTMVAAVSAEEPSSSRSGRKIKPKKFFDDGEEVPAAKAAVAKVATPEAAKPAAAGRGRRKTIVAAVAEPDAEEDEPSPVVSREEILAIVGDQQQREVTPIEEESKQAEEPTSGIAQEETDGPSNAEDDTSVEAEQPVTTSDVGDSPENPEEKLAEVGPSSDGTVTEPAGNFPETQIEPTPPLATPATARDDPVPSAEATAEVNGSASSFFSEALLVDEEATTTDATTVEEKMEELFESVEFLEDSAVAGRLSDVVTAAAAAAVVVSEDVPAELLDQELGEVMAGEIEQEDVPEADVQPEVEEQQEPELDEPEPVREQEPEAVEEAVQEQEPEPEPTATDDQTEELGEAPEEHARDSVASEASDINRTKPPADLNDSLLDSSSSDSVGESKSQQALDQEDNAVTMETPTQPELPEPESKVIEIPESPVVKQVEAADNISSLTEELPEQLHTTNNTVANSPEAPFGVSEQPIPATPKSHKSNPSTGTELCSPDKPDEQTLASVPQQQPEPEVIEIMDSPVVVLHGARLTVKERIDQSSRKRSLSASDADVSTKKNVTFHSPSNSAILVDTLDERLKKSSNKTKIGRKRSFSEHGSAVPADGQKPSKIGKLPNFKTIHQNHFSRMESIADYQKRKDQRAKDILTVSATKSPAVARHATPSRSAAPSTIIGQQKNGDASSTVATQLKFTAAKPAAASSTTTTTAAARPVLSNEARQEKRQLHFKAAFRNKSADTSSSTNTDEARRVVEQSRHKQHQILKGVRTNKRFELLMKFRDASTE